MALITVIIPVYNAEARLEATLQSLLRQTFADWRAVMVNDGSRDASAAICRRYCASDPRFSLIDKEQNQGLSEARNSALSGLEPEGWVTFLDDDDLLPPEALQTMLGVAQSSGAKLVASPLLPFYKESQLPERAPRRDYRLMSGEEAVAEALYQTGISSSLNGKLYHNSLWQQTRMRPGILYEDLDIFWRPMLAAGSVALLREPLYYYRQRRGSIVHSFTPRRADVLEVTQRLEQQFQELQPLHPSLPEAVRDRRLAASFDMLMLFAGRGAEYEPLRQQCWQTIRAQRCATMRNPRTRMKNRLGALLSFILGRSGLEQLGRFRKGKA